jgi:NIMA-interacting peptidyl-prolyl cis-trans isomerase 1
MSNSKNLPYYFNPQTKESRWEPPEGSDTGKLKEYIARTHISAGSIRGAASNGGSDGKIRAAHLLIKHRDSRRPASWRDPNITRSKEEAMNILKLHEQRIKSGQAKLGDIAMTESDCSSARKQGDL